VFTPFQAPVTQKFCILLEISRKLKKKTFNSPLLVLGRRLLQCVAAGAAAAGRVVAHGALAGDTVAALFPPRVLLSVRLQRLRCGHRHFSQRASSDDARKSRVRCDKSAESNARSRRRCACFISTHLLLLLRATTKKARRS